MYNKNIYYIKKLGMTVRFKFITFYAENMRYITLYTDELYNTHIWIIISNCNKYPNSNRNIKLQAYNLLPATMKFVWRSHEYIKLCYKNQFNHRAIK